MLPLFAAADDAYAIMIDAAACFHHRPPLDASSFDVASIIDAFLPYATIISRGSLSFAAALLPFHFIDVLR